MNFVRKISGGHSFTASELFDLTVGGLVCLLTYIVSQYYVGGDQIGYSDAYHAIRGLDPMTALKVHGKYISTKEYVYVAISYIATNFVIDKEIFFSFVNGILSVIIMRFMRSLNVNIYVILFFIFSNYYLLVCYFTAERLKIAFLFFVAAMLFRSLTTRYLFFILALLSHVTIVLLFLGSFAKKTFLYFRGYKDQVRQKISTVLIFALIASVFTYYLGEYVMWKFWQYYYVADVNFRSMIPILLCIFASVFYTERRADVFFDFVPLIVIFFLLGGSRINMFAYIMFLKYGLQYNRGLNAGVALTNLYFAYKGLIFLNNVFEFGQGF